MKQEELDKIYADFAAYEKEVGDHNEKVLKFLGKKANKDFEESLEGCRISEKMSFVEAPKGRCQDEDCGVFKNIHVDQRSVGLEGDSFEGFIYAKIKGAWLQIPFEA